MLGEQVVEHARVLHADKGAQHAEHPGRHAQIEAHAVGVPGTCAGAGADDQLVMGQIGHDLVEQRKDGGPAAVDHALAADLDHVGVRQDGQGGRRICLRQQRLVRQGAGHECRAKLRQELVLHDPSHVTSHGPRILAGE